MLKSHQYDLSNAKVRMAAEELFGAADHASIGHLVTRRQVSLRLDWGCFDFMLECLPPSQIHPDTTIGISIRHHEPIDIILARKLWGWPLSPREKRLLIASTREPSLAQLAAVLGLTVGTVKFYLHEMKIRLGVESRQDLIEWVLHASPDVAGKRVGC